jgi:hypothetical protein
MRAQLAGTGIQVLELVPPAVATHLGAANPRALPLDAYGEEVIHPVVGEMHLYREKLPVDGLLLVMYYADPDSESGQKLALLGALSAHSAAG